MTKQNKTKSGLGWMDNQSKRGNNKKPPEATVTGHMWTGLMLLVALLAAIFALWKPFAPRTEYLVIAPPSATSESQIQKALTDTGALPDPKVIKLAPEGLNWKVISSDAKTPVKRETWLALAKQVPSKLSGAKVTYRADAPGVINLGLDLQGGLRVTLEAKDEKTGRLPTTDELNVIRTIVESRVNQTGVAEPLVQVNGKNRVIVELPGLSQADQSRALGLIGQSGKLEFRIVNEQGLAKLNANNGNAEVLGETDLAPAQVTGEMISNAQSAFDQFGSPYVSMRFNAVGTRAFGQVTSSSIGKQMAIVLDGKVKSAPRINQAILGGDAQITGQFTLEETNDLALVLRSGSLPVPVKVIETRAIGATLGQDAIRQGLVASIVGILAIVVLLFVYYGFWFGLVAALGLIFSGLIIFGIFAGLGGALTLPGIAGLVLTIGAAVDGNVISFERIKEELRGERGLKTAIKGGFGHSLATIVDVNLSHLLSALALYSYATGPVKGFAVMLAVGVVASTFSNLVFSKWMLEVLAERFKFSAPQWFATPNVNFMGAARTITTASVVLAVLGLGIVLTKGFNWGVDFTSGTSFTLRTDAGTNTTQVRELVGGAGIKGVSAEGASIVETQTLGTPGKDYTVRVSELAKADQDKLQAALQKLPGGRVDQIETVGPAVGNELRGNTLAAVGWALLLTLIYVAVRFDIILGIGSVLAVAHDVFIALGLFALLGREFTITTVAAILTLIGYSLNDSIIVSDRIRENTKLMRGQPFAKIVNASINQTLSRTLMTSVATMLPLVALLLFGGPVLRDFSLILLIGIIVGTYSSIYIVSPMAVYYKDWQAKNAKAPRSTARG